MRFPVKTLDDFEYVLELPESDKSKNKSKLHIAARKLAHKIFPSFSIYEETKVKTYKRKTLRFDLFIPSLRIFVEIQGAQHGKYTPYFHKSVRHFEQARRNDESKKEWCVLNNFILIELNADENIDQWETKIIESLNDN